MKFIIMVWAAFRARVKPVSASAKPACMNITRKPATRTQTKLSDTRVWPTADPISSSVGLPTTFAGTFAIPPVLSPVASARIAHDTRSNPASARKKIDFFFVIQSPSRGRPFARRVPPRVSSADGSEVVPKAGLGAAQRGRGRGVPGLQEGRMALSKRHYCMDLHDRPGNKAPL